MAVKLSDRNYFTIWNNPQFYTERGNDIWPAFSRRKQNDFLSLNLWIMSWKLYAP